MTVIIMQIWIDCWLELLIIGVDFIPVLFCRFVKCHSEMKSSANGCKIACYVRIRFNGISDWNRAKREIKTKISKTFDSMVTSVSFDALVAVLIFSLSMQNNRKRASGDGQLLHNFRYRIAERLLCLRARARAHTRAHTARSSDVDNERKTAILMKSNGKYFARGMWAQTTATNFKCRKKQQHDDPRKQQTKSVSTFVFFFFSFVFIVRNDALPAHC